VDDKVAAVDNKVVAADNDKAVEPRGNSDFNDSIRISNTGFPKSINKTSPIITDNVSNYSSNLEDKVSIMPAI
jgi:hypothetical protein